MDGNGRASIWNDKPELDEALQQSLKDGFSFALIARKLSLLAGREITRMAAIGRAKRQKLNGPPKPPKQWPTQPPKFKTVPVATLTRKLKQARAATESPLPTASVAAFTKTLMDLEAGDCRYPDGEDPIMFCDQRAVKGSPYCAHHSAICYGK